MEISPLVSTHECLCPQKGGALKVNVEWILSNRSDQYFEDFEQNQLDGEVCLVSICHLPSVSCFFFSPNRVSGCGYGRRSSTFQAPCPPALEAWLPSPPTMARYVCVRVCVRMCVCAFVCVAAESACRSWICCQIISSSSLRLSSPLIGHHSSV